MVTRPPIADDWRVELLVLFAPLFLGPFVFAYGVTQLLRARFLPTTDGLPTARIHAPSEEPESSQRRRGKRNLATGALLSVGLFLVFLSLIEAAR